MTAALLAVAFLALVGAIVLKSRYGLTWAPVAIGSVMAVFGTVSSVAWERVYRQELEGAAHGR